MLYFPYITSKQCFNRFIVLRGKISVVSIVMGSQCDAFRHVSIVDQCTMMLCDYLPFNAMSSAMHCYDCSM